jgi:hypothetical protein
MYGLPDPVIKFFGSIESIQKCKKPKDLHGISLGIPLKRTYS